MNYRNNYGAGGKMPAWLLKKLKNRAMANGGKLRYYAVGGELDNPTGEEGDLLAALNRANKANEDAGRWPYTGDGYVIKGDDDPNFNIIKDVIPASETTNRMGGVDPQVATLKYVPRTPGMTKTIEEKPVEKPEEKERTIIPPEFPTEEPKDIPTEVDFNMDTEGLSSMPIFKRGIESTGMRGQGTTGDFRGVRSDITKDGRLMEKGEVTSVEDMPEYIREDPTFKNLLAQANETKYMQDIGRKEGLYMTPGGQAAKDLADIMSGRITLDAYKERQNRASASFGYGGKMKFGVVKKRRGGR